MNRKRIENSLKDAVNCAPQLPVEELFTMPYIKMTEHDYITKQIETKKNSNIRQFTTAVACSLLLLVLTIGWYIQNRMPDSIITLDVNPSIEIITNHKDNVISVNALNEDAREIIGDNFSAKTLEDTVELLVSSLVEHNFISTGKNTVLLTVMNNNNKKADEIMTRMGTVINDSLTERNIMPVILSQIIDEEADRAELAKTYHVSEGKMELILDMISDHNELSIDTLVNLSMEELLKLARHYHMDLSKYLSLYNNAIIPAQEDAGDTQKDADKNILEDSKETDQNDSGLNEDNPSEATEDSEANDDLKEDNLDEEDKDYDLFEEKPDEDVREQMDKELDDNDKNSDDDDRDNDDRDNDNPDEDNANDGLIDDSDEDNQDIDKHQGEGDREEDSEAEPDDENAEEEKEIYDNGEGDEEDRVIYGDGEDAEEDTEDSLEDND